MVKQELVELIEDAHKNAGVDIKEFKDYLIANYAEKQDLNNLQTYLDPNFTLPLARDTAINNIKNHQGKKREGYFEKVSEHFNKKIKQGHSEYHYVDMSNYKGMERFKKNPDTLDTMLSEIIPYVFEDKKLNPDEQIALSLLSEAITSKTDPQKRKDYIKRALELTPFDMKKDIVNEVCRVIRKNNYNITREKLVDALVNLGEGPLLGPLVIDCVLGIFDVAAVCAGSIPWTIGLSIALGLINIPYYYALTDGITNSKRDTLPVTKELKKGISDFLGF